MKIEDEEMLLFRIVRLENRVKKFELSPSAMPAMHAEFSAENPVVRSFYCYISSAFAKISTNAPSGDLSVQFNGKTYSMTAPSYICVPLKKGSNTFNVSGNVSQGDLLVEILKN